MEQAPLAVNAKPVSESTKPVETRGRRSSEFFLTIYIVTWLFVLTLCGVEVPAQTLGAVSSLAAAYGLGRSYLKRNLYGARQDG